jgi:signal transduction histidine kinase
VTGAPRRFWRWLASFRRRILFRGVFLLLALATVALALAVLQQEKQLAYANYREGLRKTEAQLIARLHHPAGQLALLNPRAFHDGVVPLRPLVLPFSALDFDDPDKVQQAVELAGCLVQYPNHGALCVGLPHRAWAGGYLYIAGRFASGPLVPRARGELDASRAHRVKLAIQLRGSSERWTAPFEIDARGSARRGRLTGFSEAGDLLDAVRPSREFRGWLWQDRDCLPGADGAACAKRSYFALRVPVEALRQALFDPAGRSAWPPPDLDRIVVHLQLLAPGEDAPLLDSDDRLATPPFSLADLKSLLLPGETLRIERAGQPVVTLAGEEPSAPARPWLQRLVRRMAVEGAQPPAELRDTVATPLGDYRIVLTGDLRSVDATLAAVATRLAGYAAAMLLAIALAWLVIELGLIRRVAVLTRRARALSRGATDDSELADLRGSDELGILATTLAELLRRERLRAEREKQQWHAVGHEIMAPLQSLMALHDAADDPSARYIRRMQQAVRVLYGSASPSEAFEASTIALQPIDLHEFLRQVARNAPHAGIEQVEFEAAAGLGEVNVRADEYSLEDVITHLLKNADRYRQPGTPIAIRLQADAQGAEVRVRNAGPAIPPELIGKVFDYGVSDPQGEGAAHRGQGLFVAKTYLAKMGGTIAAHNLPGGVEFAITLPRA